MRRFRGLAVSVLAILVAAQALPAAEAAHGPQHQSVVAPAPLRQADATGLGLYLSPTFGYILTWPTSIWQLVEESTDGAADHLAIESAVGTVAFDAFAGYDGDEERCVRDMGDELAQRDGVREVRPAEFISDFPVYSEGTEDELGLPPLGYFQRTYIAVEATEQGEPREVAWLVRCFALVQDEAVLRASYATPIEQYDNDVLPVEALLDSVALPRSAYRATSDRPPVLLPTISRECGGVLEPSHPVPILDADGAAAGIVAIVASEVLADRQEEAILLAFQNTGATPLTVDASAFFVQGPEGEVAGEPASAAWLTGDDPDGSARELAPNEVGVARVVFSPTFRVEGVFYFGVYRASSEQALWVGAVQSPRCAGGARPRIRVSG